jgi:Fic family protein
MTTEKQGAANRRPENVGRIEPARLERAVEEISDLVAELFMMAAHLEHALHPRTAANLVDLVRIVNAYYSNLIEGRKTPPNDIARALDGKFDKDEERRNLQMEAAAHVRVQAEVDRLVDEQRLPEPSSPDFIRWLHRELYRDAPEEVLVIQGEGRELLMKPGEWRSHPEHAVAVGGGSLPSSDRVADFMAYFERCYSFDRLGKAGRVMAIAAAYHRFNYVRPFPDGNGHVSRLMSHAMARLAGVGAHGLWSISRGLALGLESDHEYKQMMDLAVSPRQSEFDGSGPLSQRALTNFTLWFLRVCLHQVTFMSAIFEPDKLAWRLRKVIERSEITLKPEAARLLERALCRGEFERCDVAYITGLPKPDARRVFAQVLRLGLLGSATPKGPVSLRFPADKLDSLFPRLFSKP